ncbi:hypothetical protein GCM10010496_08420 [Streptomyces asoensis]|nr:hypothetical protein GCM10010496_08420 [Streptomyces asoensis]
MLLGNPQRVDTYCPRRWTADATGPPFFGRLLAEDVDTPLSRKLDKLCTKCHASRVQKSGRERRTVDYRYRLHSGDLLRRLMDDHSADEPGSTRELAEAVGLSKSKVDALVHETRPTVSRAEARRVAQAYSLPPRALFHPVSMSMDMDSDPLTRKEASSADGYEPAGALAPGPSRRAHQLGEHARPGEQDGESASRGRRPV